MQVNEAAASAMAVYKGRTYYFCNETCRVIFEKSPEKYASAR